MSDHFIELFKSPPQLTLVFTVFVASLIGSPHCSAMCGPLLAFSTQGSRKQELTYHLFKLISYASIGALSGFIGKQLFQHQLKPILIASSIFMSLFFIYLGFQLISKSPRKNAFFTRWPQALMAKVFRIKMPNHFRSGAVGLLTPFLPCGWLYGFVAASSVLESPTWGAVLMISFGLGTIPALSAVGIIWKQGLRSKYLNYLLAFVFFNLGVWNLYARASQIFIEYGQPTCH